MKNTKTITLYAVATALCFIGVFIRIPLPTGGMIHLGNLFALAFSILFSPTLGAVSASLGMGLFNVFTGYPLYIVIRTIIVKFIMAFTAGKLHTNLQDKNKYAVLLAVTAAVLINTLLEFVFNFTYNIFIFDFSIEVSLYQALLGLASALLNSLITVIILVICLPKLKK